MSIDKDEMVYRLGKLSGIWFRHAGALREQAEARASDDQSVFRLNGQAYVYEQCAQDLDNLMREKLEAEGDRQ